MAVIAVYGIVFLRREFSARAGPSSIETPSTITALKLAVPSDYREVHNPLPASTENPGWHRDFAYHCATCHGNDGSGDTLFGRSSIRNLLTCGRPKRRTRVMVICTAPSNEVRLSGMPAFGEHPGIGDVETWHVDSRRQS